MTVKEILSKIVTVFFSRIFETIVAILLYIILIDLQISKTCEKEVKEIEKPPAATREYKV